MKLKQWLGDYKLFLIGGLLGAIAGYLYWQYVGCLTGTCAITSSPVRSTIYFGIMGALGFGMFRKRSGNSNSEVNKLSD